MHAADESRGYILVIFEPATAGDEAQQARFVSDEPVARQLEDELMRLKSQLRSSIEQHEFQAEELKASNEELQAMNEELRSAAEELETGKEELQSINEELITVNQELKVKVEEVSMSSNNLQNLINATDIGTIFLDRSLRVVLFTPASGKIFNLIAADYGRSLSDITNRLRGENIMQDAEAVLSKLQHVEREVQTIDNRYYLMHALPYRTIEDRIEGVVISFIDITSRRQAEEALRQSEDRLRITMESASDYAIIATDVSGIITSWSSGAVNIFGYTVDEALGQSANLIFTPEDIAAGVPRQEMDTAARDGRASDDRWHVRRDGSYFFMSGIVSPINQDGLTGFVKVAQDMTERKAAEEALRLSEERHRITLQSAGMGAWDWNVTDDVIIWNEQHYLLLDLQPGTEAMRSQDFLRFVHPNDIPLVTAALQAAIEEQGHYQASFRVTTAGGRQRWMSGYGKVVATRHGKASRLVGVMYDITEQKALEQQKDEFIGIASHELKTPVTSIKAYAEVLQEMFTEAEDNYSAELMGKLDAQIDRLSGLIHSLLDTTRISEGELLLRPEYFDLDALVKATVDELGRTAPGHRLVVMPAGAMQVFADRERISQVLSNLISNAVKYSPAGGEIIIATIALEQGVQVSVRDFGIGMTPATQEKIFDRFYRVSSKMASTFPGLGLGLYIASQIIKRHGGKIGVESIAGKGSTFYFTLPAHSGEINNRS